MNALLDTSGMVASVDRRDARHADARAFLRQPGLQLATTSVIAGELYTMIRRRLGNAAALEWARSGRQSSILSIHHPSAAEESVIWETLSEFAGVPLSYADASLIALGRTLRISTVFSFDSDFRAVGLTTVP